MHSISLLNRCSLPSRILRATAGVFVMVKLRLRRIDDSITSLPQFEAKIDVVESDLKILFVEAAYLQINLPPHQHASGPDRG